MNEELQKQLASLASKLNVSVEHLWGVLVRQAYIDGISSLCTMLVCMVLGVAAVYAFFHLRRKFQATPERDRLSFYPPAPMDLMLLGMVLLFLLMIALSNFYWVISDFLNPEFYAFQHLPFSK